MNKLKIKIIAIVFIVLLGSCKDWLTIVPQDGITLQEYWQSEKDVFGAVMGIYASMLSSAPGSRSIPELMFEWGEMRADMVAQYRSYNGYYTYVKNGDILPTLYICSWNSFYRTINYCNTLLELAPAVLEKDESFTIDELNKFRAEALAVRAMCYLQLIKTYDQVPLVLEATISDQINFRRKKSTRQEVYNQIIKDLKEAQKYAVMTFNNVPESKGRITKNTVFTIQADAYLWAGDYSNCAAACDSVMNSGMYSLVERNDEWFSNLYVLKNSTESIFELQYNNKITNPLYFECGTPGYYRANPEVMDFFFLSDPYALPDSLDIRGDRGSYRSSISYTIWKYTGLNKTQTKTTSDVYFNFIVYRYAEVLLMKAEALAASPDVNQEDLDEALNLIKQIRYRAHATEQTNEETPTIDANGILNFILNERAREFAFEGKRWYDILRFAKRNNYQRRDIIESMLLRSAPAERLVTILNKYQDTLFHYLPIPQADINAGYPELEQNPYYADK